jgi:PIN domain nuclease of toxin-antitoxin system
VKILLDTHALLWWLFDDPQLSNAARKAIKDPENTVLVSSASVWEIATKYRLGKLPEARAAAEDLPGLLRRGNMDVLPITLDHALAAGSLPGLHRDPFDRMLITQSQLEAIPIVTLDPAFSEFPIDTIW